jgi:CxxC motif-containing protein (DUF1111 family)
MRRAAPVVMAVYAIAGVAAAGLPDADLALALLEARSGGDATSPDRSRSAFTQHAPGLSGSELAAFALGNRVFSTPWVEAGASVAHFDGLGPFYSSRSCSGCHLRDGRGRPPGGPDDIGETMLVRLGAADGPRTGLPDPRYGRVLSGRAVRGLAAEGRLEVRWEEIEHRYPDGTRARLRRPRARVADAAYGPLARDTRISARIAPAVIGVGLLEAIPDSVLAALADPDDADRDGISGRVHWRNDDALEAFIAVRHPAAATKPGPLPRAGRFGWKAAQVTLAAQVTAALAEDMGITTPSRPRPELSAAQVVARGRANGGEPELDGEALEALLAYCRLIAVPARRDVDDPAVRRGAERFRELGCASCHVPALTTGEAPAPALARQVVHPFSDLLLHDMGPELSDRMPEGAARASEWRTAPLWGLGLAATVNGYLYLLHDGRARTTEEAILWHDGEARRSRNAFRSLPASGRSDLLRFLDSL